MNDVTIRGDLQRSTLMLPGLGPVPGDVWTNLATGQQAVIVSIQQRRVCWVTIRTMGGERELRLDLLNEFWRPM